MRALVPAGLLTLVLLSCCADAPDAAGPVSHEGPPPVPGPETARFNVNLPALGSALPAFSAQTLDGRTIDNAAIAGKTTLLNFWFHGCPPCRKELPELKAIYEGLEGRDDIAFFAVNSGVDSLDVISKYWAKQAYPFDALTGDSGRTAATMGVMAYPTNVVVSPDGKVLWASVGFDEHAIRYYLGI